MRLQTPATALVLALLLVGCGTPATELAEPTTTALVAAEGTSTTVAASSTTAAPAPEDEIYELLTTEVIYHEDEEGTWSMDVVYPDSEGPWPLVVVYHGMTTAPALAEARSIAERGSVAVAPQWLKETGGAITRAEYIDGMLFDRAACAVNTAQSIASEYGADAAQTTVSGFSAGMHPTHWVGLGIVRHDLCSNPLLHAPVGVVMGDSQFIFYEAGWDDTFADVDGQGVDTLDRFVNPERWDVPSDIAVYLWTSDYPYSRDIGNPPGDGSWIHLRDTTGSLVDDLAAVEAFEDRNIDWMDNGLLMEALMLAAGIDVEHEAVGGGHFYGESVFAAIEELIHR